MKRFFEIVGGLSVIIGMAGIAGAIELDQSLARPLVIVIIGALMMGATSILEVVKPEKNINSFIPDSSYNTRPKYLR